MFKVFLGMDTQKRRCEDVSKVQKPLFWYSESWKEIIQKPKSKPSPQGEGEGEKEMQKGIYKLTGDFEVVPYSGKFVRDINLTPDDRRLPDIAICRVFSSREDAEKILSTLQNQEKNWATYNRLSYRPRGGKEDGKELL